ncbi:DUF6927 domain-containing protein [Saccharopolyspora griseoalba]|uniref:DUF6927 domain-containing protein n=1 Tax=Saccharopolyspora griseoalba TaxID=1431848 RepID=A0ABW2LS28_9PSEU
MASTTAFSTLLSATSTAKVWALIVLMSKQRGWITYKDMCETVGPYEAQAPAKVLNALSPTDNEHALEWRRQCRANLDREREVRARKQTIREGTVIEVAPALTMPSGDKAARFRCIVRDKSLFRWVALTSVGELGPVRLPGGWVTDLDWKIVDKSNK